MITVRKIGPDQGQEKIGPDQGQENFTISDPISDRWVPGPGGPCIPDIGEVLTYDFFAV